MIARIVGVEPHDTSVDGEVLNAFTLDDIRNVDVESGYAIDQLENIAWAVSSSAPADPEHRGDRHPGQARPALPLAEGWGA